MKSLIGSAWLAMVSAALAGCSTEEASVLAPCEIREIARVCDVESNERFVSVSRTSAPCLAGVTVDGVNVSIPYQPLRTIGDAELEDIETATGYDEYLISLLPSRPVADSATPGVLYACSEMCRAVMSWRGYAVVVSWGDVKANPGAVVKSAIASLDAWAAQCREGAL